MDGNLAYQEELCEELIGGRLVAMAPASTNHNIVSGNIYRIFGNYLAGKPCTPFADGEAVYLTRTDHFIPDGMIICDRDKIKPDGVHGAPDLVVEVLSPSTEKYDRGRKKEVYEQCGVRELWLVDISNQSIEVYLPKNGRFVLDNIYAVRPGQRAAEFQCGLFDGMTIRLDEVFADMLFED